MALILQARRGKKIYIGDNISVQLWEHQSGQIRIAIDAPHDMNIAREEILNEQEISRREQIIENNKLK